MTRALAIYQSSVGKKAMMAVTGLIGVGFILGHMLGNLQAFPFFGGAQALNEYAAFLRKTHGLLWVVRFVLLTAVVLHVVAAYQLTRQSWRSRPVSYNRWDAAASSYASRTMRWSGPILLLFIIYHLMHLTLGNAHPNFVEGDVYTNVVNGFRVWYVSAFYIVAQLALGLHLFHGFWSMFQSMGLNTPKYDGMLRTVASAFTLIVTAGNISIPVGVMMGIIR